MILIIDNYDSFTYNLVHLVAQWADQYEVVRNDAISTDEVADLAPQAILISPGPGRPAAAGITEEVISRYGKTISILGVCLGHQAIGEVFGATIIHAPRLMHGKTSAIHHDGKGVFQGVKNDFIATRYHSLVLDPASIPDELEISARSEDGLIMGLRHRTYPIEGMQFHPESYMTDVGPQMIRNWIKSSQKKQMQAT